MKKQLIIIILISSFSTGVTAQNNIITTSVPYMRIGADARAGGMGDAGVATSADAASIFWNSAKSLFASKPINIGLNYTSWFREVGANDIYLLSTSGYKRINDQSSITGGIRYFSQGTIKVTSPSGDLLSVYRPRDWDISFGYNRKVNTKLGIGVTIRYINSNLSAGGNGSSGFYAKSTSTVAGDISLFYKGENEKGAGLNWGLNISNLGAKMSYKNTASTDKDYLPANLALGGNYNWVLNEKSKFSVAIDVNKLLVPIFPQASGNNTTDSLNMIEYRKGTVVKSWFKSFSDGGGFFNSLSYSIGAEFNYNHLFAARIGYYTEDKNRGNRKFFSAGLSVYYNKTGLHLSYLVPTANSNRNILANTIRLGLVFE